MYKLKLKLTPTGYNPQRAYEIPDGCVWVEQDGPIGLIEPLNGWQPEVKPREARQEQPEGRHEGSFNYAAPSMQPKRTNSYSSGRLSFGSNASSHGAWNEPSSSSRDYPTKRQRSVLSFDDPPEQPTKKQKTVLKFD